MIYLFFVKFVLSLVLLRLVLLLTPLPQVTKSNEEPLSFYSLPEFQEWKDQTKDFATWKVKYYKGEFVGFFLLVFNDNFGFSGLGTSTSKEAKEYFSDMGRHKIVFIHNGPEDDEAIDMAFSKKKSDERKVWLTRWMEEGKRRKLLNLPEVYLYEKDTKAINYTEFVDKELILFSNMDNERSIPCLVDGFKPCQRKVMFTCFQRNLTKEVKVAQLAGSVSEKSAYHH